MPSRAKSFIRRCSNFIPSPVAAANLIPELNFVLFAPTSLIFEMTDQWWYPRGGLIAHDEVEVCSWLLLENCSESVRRRVNSGPTQADAQPEYDLRDDVDPGWEEDDVTFACISPIDRLLDRDRVIT